MKELSLPDKLNKNTGVCNPQANVEACRHLEGAKRKNILSKGKKGLVYLHNLIHQIFKLLKIIMLLIYSITPVYVTAFWALVLNFYDINKHAPKVFLGKFMIVSFILYLSHFFYFTRQADIYYYLDSFYILASLLVFPLYHIYIRLLTVEKRFNYSQHGKFLIMPAFIFVLYLPGVLMMSAHEHAHFLAHIHLPQHLDAGLQKYLLAIYYAARVVFVLQVFYYLYLNFYLIKENNKRLEDFYSNTKDRRLQWVQFFNISLAVTSLASIAAAITGREAFAAGEYSLAGPSVIFSSMLFSIGLLGNTQNTVFPSMVEPEEDALQKQPTNDTRLKKQLEELMEKKQVFRNPDLKIWDICKMLGTNRTYISRLINHEYNQNFCNHVNHYRVVFVINELTKAPGLSNEQLAELAGFGSVSSLYRAFQSSQKESFSSFRKKTQQ